MMHLHLAMMARRERRAWARGFALGFAFAVAVLTLLRMAYTWTY